MNKCLQCGDEFSHNPGIASGTKEFNFCSTICFEIHIAQNSGKNRCPVEFVDDYGKRMREAQERLYVQHTLSELIRHALDSGDGKKALDIAVSQIPELCADIIQRLISEKEALRSQIKGDSIWISDGAAEVIRKDYEVQCERCGKQNEECSGCEVPPLLKMLDKENARISL